MSETTVKAIIKHRSDTESNWNSKNPILLQGEIGYDTTNKKFKIGDGDTKWKDLNYAANITDLDEYVPRENWNTTDSNDDNYYSGYKNMKELADATYFAWDELSGYITMPEGYPQQYYAGLDEVAASVYDLEQVDMINCGNAFTDH